MGVADPPLLGHVELAPEPPVVLLQEVRRGVLGRHRDVAHVLPGVLLPLEIPGAFPDLPLAQSRGLVPQDGQERDRLALDQFIDQGCHVEVGATSVKGGDLEEVVVAAGLVGKLGGGLQGRLVSFGIGPVAGAFKPVEEPVPQRTLLLVLPGLIVPAALVFRSSRSGRSPCSSR